MTGNCIKAVIINFPFVVGLKGTVDLAQGIETAHGKF
jgi:hypothetical protein